MAWLYMITVNLGHFNKRVNEISVQVVNTKYVGGLKSKIKSKCEFTFTVRS